MGGGGVAAGLANQALVVGFGQAVGDALAGELGVEAAVHR
jgi:hypothetical protein